MAPVPVGPSGFQVRLQDMINSRKQRILLLEAETKLHINKRQVLQTKNSRVRQVQQASFHANVKAEEMARKVKAIEDQKVRADLALKDLESKQRVLNVELFELRKEKDQKSKFYESKKAEMREFTLVLQKRALTIRKETQEVRTQADELKVELQSLRQLRATFCEADAATDAYEKERIRLTSIRQVIIRKVSSNGVIVNDLEERLHQTLQSFEKKKRELAPAVEALKAEIILLQATHRTLEEQVVQVINKRDGRKRKVHDVEIELAQKKKSLYSCQKVD